MVTSREIDRKYKHNLGYFSSTVKTSTTAPRYQIKKNQHQKFNRKKICMKSARNAMLSTVNKRAAIKDELFLPRSCWDTTAEQNCSLQQHWVCIFLFYSVLSLLQYRQFLSHRLPCEIFINPYKKMINFLKLLWTKRCIKHRRILSKENC